MKDETRCQQNYRTKNPKNNTNQTITGEAILEKATPSNRVNIGVKAFIMPLSPLGIRVPA